MIAPPLRYCADLEQPQPDEAETDASLEKSFNHILETTAADYGHAVRAVHAKAHGLFEGTFTTPFIGDYRTDLTAHVFRSLAEAMGAAVHITVTGNDDHHKTEAVYKAFGRALRQAIRVEGDVVPSTKGVL